MFVCKIIWYDDGVYDILGLYVDDILIFGCNIDIIKDVKHLLWSNFDMKDHVLHMLF